jgi:hypothetical protein
MAGPETLMNPTNRGTSMFTRKFVEFCISHNTKHQRNINLRIDSVEYQGILIQRPSFCFISEYIRLLDF